MRKSKKEIPKWNFPEPDEDDIVLYNVPIRKLHHPRICVFANEDKNLLAHFHLISEVDNFQASFCMFYPLYYWHGHDEDIPSWSLRPYQLEDLNKFLAKPRSFRTRKYETNWTYIAQWYQDETRKILLEGYKGMQPDYTMTTEFHNYHESEPIKIDEFLEYDVVVFKELQNQPHFHLISRKRDKDCPIQLYSYGQYLRHEYFRDDKLSIQECFQFDRWMDDHWDHIKNKFLEVNADKEYENKPIWEDMKKCSKPSYINLFHYIDLGYYGHMDIYAPNK